MDNDIRGEHICFRVGEILNKDGVKLWLKPYYVDGKSDATEMERLAEKYCPTLKLPIAELRETLTVLQNRSLCRIREQEQFQASGVLTVRVKISGSGWSDPNEPSCSRKTPGTGPRQICVETFPTDLGKALLHKVADSAGIPAYRLKLIAHGRILDNDASLESQGIKNCSQIMAVVLTENPEEVNNATSRHKLLEDTRADVMTLVNAQKTSYFELQDQKGNALELPATERKALFMAMALHERGRTIMGRGDHALALVLFLESDREFKKCASELLKSVDNAALLNLDIAWCYLCLRSVSYLPDAQRRLQSCLEMLIRSYGPNMERVVALKGSSGNEAVLMMRLHLLQAIVSFHQNKIEDCRRLFLQAEEELKRLKVKDEDLCALMALGYKASEARLGLRAAHGDLSRAEVYIREWQREKREARERNQQRRHLERKRRKLGLCADGRSYVEPSLLKMMEKMGFDRATSICALAETNNVVSRAVEIIQEQPHILQARAGPRRIRLDRGDLEQVMAMGFDRKSAKSTLKKFEGNVQKAVEHLLQNPMDEGASEGEEERNKSAAKGANGATNNGGSTSETSEDEEDPEASQNQEQAFKRLAPDIESADDNHLDQTLAAEERFLSQYKILLECVDQK